MSQSSGLSHQQQQRYTRNDDNHVPVTEMMMMYGNGMRRNDHKHPPVECPATDTTSTISMSDKSQESLIPVRTRTNFGEYQYYVSPPELKSKVHPVSPNRYIHQNQEVLVGQPHQSQQQHCGRKCRSAAHAASNSGRTPEPRESTRAIAALCEEVSPVQNQIPFDQVWNQQEFTLDDEQRKDGEVLHYESLQSTRTKAVGMRVETDMPFDEDGSSDLSPKLSAFSAYGIAGSPTHSRMSETLFTIDEAKLNTEHHPSPFDYFIMPPPRVSEPSRLQDVPASSSPSSRRPNQHDSRVEEEKVGQKEGRQDPPASDGRDREYVSEPSASDDMDSVSGGSPQQQQQIQQLQLPQLSPQPQQQNRGDHADDDDIPSDEDHPTLYVEKPPHMSLSESSKSKGAKYLGGNQRLSQESPNHLSLTTTSTGKIAQNLTSERKLKSTTAKRSSSKKRCDSDDDDDIDDDDFDDDDKSVDSLFDFKDLPSSPKSPDTKSTLLFDFKEDALPKLADAFPSSSPKESGDSWRRRVPAIAHSSESDTGTSLEGDDVASVSSKSSNKLPDLKSRAQEAFATRKKSSLAKSPKRKPQVSFGATDTIHHFEHFEEEHDYSDTDHSEEGMLHGTYEYTKTVDSDVEDAIKDLLMINALGGCNSGPASLLYAGAAVDRCDPTEIDYYDPGMTDEEEVVEEKPARSLKKKSSVDSADGPVAQIQAMQREDVFFESMLSMVEGGMSAVSIALGLTPDPAAKPDKPHLPEFRQSPRRVVDAPEIITTREDPAASSSSVEGSVEEELEEALFETVSEYILPGVDKAASSSSEESSVSNSPRHTEAPDLREEEHFDTELEIVPDQHVEGGQSLEEDPRLLELAKQAAHCKHEVLGVPYDRTGGVDIGEVKFVVIELVLPLGIIFQEDFCGCWITKVMPDGNADIRGGLEAGDQLAAINGTSSIGMKVDDICSKISEASVRNRVVELTFLRYVGSSCEALASPRRLVPEDVSSIADDTTMGTSSVELLRPVSGRLMLSTYSESTDELELRDFTSTRGMSRNESGTKTKDSAQKKGFGIKKLRLFNRGKKASR